MRSPKGAADDEPANKKQKAGMLFGAQLHTTPLGRGRSRLLFNVGVFVVVGITFESYDI